MTDTIRTATEADVPSLGILRGQAIETGYSGEHERTAFADLVTDARTAVADWVTAPETTVLLAETPVTPVGYVAFDPQTGHLRSICTSPEYQREGVASALLAAAESRVQAAGTTELRATVPDVARAFFEAQGFEPGGASDWHGIEATTMRKRVVD